MKVKIKENKPKKKEILIHGGQLWYAEGMEELCHVIQFSDSFASGSPDSEKFLMIGLVDMKIPIQGWKLKRRNNMSATAIQNGKQIIYLNNLWVYQDTGKPIHGFFVRLYRKLSLGLRGF